MKKLLIAGDSLSMSRYRDDVPYDAMYSTLLATRLRDWLVVNGSLRANTSRRVVSIDYQEEYVLPLSPDVVVLQVGIVDCMPRLMSKYERHIVGLMARVRGFRYLARLYISFKSKRRYFFTKNKKIVFVGAPEFRSNIIKFRDLLGGLGCGVIAINIPCPGKRLSDRTFGVDGVVSEYNKIIDEVFCGAGCAIVDLYGMTRSNPSLLQDDGYHIRRECHELIYEEILGKVAAWL